MTHPNDQIALTRRTVLGAAASGLVPIGLAHAQSPPQDRVPLPVADVLPTLRAVVDADGVLVGEEIGKKYLARGQQTKPIAVLRPTSTAQVSAILKLCSAAKLPVVPQGGMTGLVGGGVAGPAEIVLSLERMTAIEGLNAVDRTMTVEAGVVLKTAQAFAAERGFLVPIDFGARGAATIGGIIATNAGGEEVVRYGMARESVLGLEVVLANGTVITAMNTMIKNNAGFDIKHMFIGSEGLLGVVTRAVLRLRPAQTSSATAFIALTADQRVPDVLRHFENALGGTLTKFEIMWADYDQFVRTYYPQTAPPLKAGFAYYVLLESTSNDAKADNDRMKRALTEAKRQKLVAEFTQAQSAEQRKSFWEIREEAGAAFGKLGPFFGYDVSLSLANMPAYGARVKAEVAQAFPGSTTLILGHVGDGNLHLIIAPGSRSAEVHQRVNEIVYGAIRDVRGSVSAEHGIGIEKREYLSWSRSPMEIALMRTMKQTLDPLGILNPGKVL